MPGLPVFVPLIQPRPDPGRFSDVKVSPGGEVPIQSRRRLLEHVATDHQLAASEAQLLDGRKPLNFIAGQRPGNCHPALCFRPTCRPEFIVPGGFWRSSCLRKGASLGPSMGLNVKLSNRLWANVNLHSA